MTDETRARGGAKQYSNKKLHKINDASFDRLELIVVIVFHLHTVAGKEHRLPCLSLVPATDFVSSRDFLVYSWRSFFSIRTFCFASLPFISTRRFFLFSLTTSFSIGDFFLLENPRLILDLRREIGYSLALHPNISMHILHTVQYISSGFEKENLSNNQELLSLLIISLILVTLMFYSGVIS